MKTCVWVRSVEGRVLVGMAWRRKAVWTLHSSYGSEEAARSMWGSPRDPVSTGEEWS